MNSKILFVYNFNKLFEILNEIKENLNFEIQFIEKNKLNEINYNTLKIILFFLKR